jgi:gamma-glutamylcyclotransferase
LTLPSKAILYFAYASNLNKKTMQEHCPQSKPRFTAVLPNYKLIFSGWSREWHGGKAGLQPFHGEKVKGGVYELPESCFRRLDTYETGYTRINVNVYDENNQMFPAVTYIQSGQVQEALPSKEYAVTIKQGYRDWGIDS